MRFFFPLCLFLLPICVSAQDAEDLPPVMLRYAFDSDPRLGDRAVADDASQILGKLRQDEGSPLPRKTQGARRFTGSSWDFSATDTSLVVPVGETALRAFGNTKEMPGMTIAFWYKPDKHYRARQLGTVASLGKVFAITGNGNFRGESPKFRFGDAEVTTELWAAPSPPAMYLNDGQWHHFAITLDYRNPIGETGDPVNNVITYADGTEVSGYPGRGSQVFTFLDPFMPGASDELVFGGPGRQRQLLDDLVIFNYALNREEMKKLVEAGSLSAHAPQVKAEAAAKVMVLEDGAELDLRGSVIHFGQKLPLTTRWSLVRAPEGGDASFADPGAKNTQVRFAGPSGRYVLRFSADNTAWQNDAYVAVEVYDKMPVTAYASAGGRPDATVRIRTPVALDGAFRLMDERNPSDARYAWSTVSGPAEAEFSEANAQNPHVHLPEPGTYVIGLEASRGRYAAQAEVTLRAVEQMITVVNPWAERAIRRWPDNTLNLDADVEQTDADLSLRFTWSKAKGPGEVNFRNPKARTTSATFSEPGVYQLKLTASNSEDSQTGFCWVNLWPDTASTDRAIIPPVPRRLSPQPPPYVHPRFFFSEADRAELTTKAKNDPWASSRFERVKESLHGTKTEEGLMNPDMPLGRAYQRLLAGDQEFSIQPIRRAMWRQLASAAYVAWIEQDEGWLRDLATVVANSARDESKWRTKFGGAARTPIALAYDLTFNAMTEDQRVDTRSLIAALCEGQVVGDFHWQYINDVYGMSTVIFGETGYDHPSAMRNLDSIRYSTDGWTTTPLGWNMEDSAYGGLYGDQAARHALALSRQFEPLHITGGMSRWNQMYFYLFYPETTVETERPEIGGHSEGNWPHSGLKWVLSRYLYPDDPMLDFVFQIGRNRGRSGKDLYDSMFGFEALDESASFASAAEARNLPLTKFDPQRGLGIVRSDWGPDATVLNFDCRFDVFDSGHIHANRNEFTLHALGRYWFVNPGYGKFDNELHSTVLIDGDGSNRMPGTFVDALVKDDFVLFAGDAKVAYEYGDKFLWPGFPIGRTDMPKKGFDTGHVWRDFFFPGSSDGVLPPLDPPPHRHRGRTDPPESTWEDLPFYVRGNAEAPLKRTLMEKAYRTAMLVRGEMPYVLIVDDIRKDSEVRDYTWTGTMGGSLRPGATATEATLFFEDDGDADGVPQMLVHVVEGNGEGSPITIEKPGQRRLLMIKRKSSAPDFKVLLVPHRKGQALPQIRCEGQQLTVSFGDGREDRFIFGDHADGRTRIQLDRTNRQKATSTTSQKRQQRSDSSQG